MYTFTKNSTYTIVTISEWMASTVKRQVRATGIVSNGRPVFKDTKKGARRMFTIPNLFATGTLIFDDSVAITIDSDLTNVLSINGFTSTITRGNACFNFIGTVDDILITMIGNLNRNFDQHDRVLAIPANNAFADNVEVPVFPSVETSHAVVSRIRTRLASAETDCRDCRLERADGAWRCPAHYDAIEDNARAIEQTGVGIESNRDTSNDWSPLCDDEGKAIYR